MKKFILGCINGAALMAGVTTVALIAWSKRGYIAFGGEWIALIVAFCTVATVSYMFGDSEKMDRQRAERAREVNRQRLEKLKELQLSEDLRKEIDAMIEKEG